ncbi:MAG: ATP-dependent Clp protease proteolytic subunit [Gracilimonas sp.]|nr:ATP-dependent Clp protease proteolytic subunit [Gracilimonas sp.]
MIHQPLGGTQGQASDIEIEAREIIRVKEELSQILADHSDQTIEQIMEDSDRNKWMTAQEAVDYGLVDNLIAKTSKNSK